ncbi:MAG: hypothetical protein KKB59_19285 [Spirochaetes bacterium]|nr:hypothetical protein [Spirochaetota bacterium]
MIKLIRCALCENAFKDKRGLSAHVRKEHEITWNEYKEKYPITEISVPKVPEETKETADTHLEERIERMENILNTLFSGYDLTGNPSGISDFPGEEIEVIGEKVNYKIALDPEIFSTYNKFKAICEKRGNTWDKDFSDFIMLSVKDAMSIHGIYDMILEVKGDRMLFEMPVGVR